MSSGRKKRWVYIILGIIGWPFGLHWIYAACWKSFFWFTVVPWALVGLEHVLPLGYFYIAAIILFFLSITQIFGNRVYKSNGYRCEMD